MAGPIGVWRGRIGYCGPGDCLARRNGPVGGPVLAPGRVPAELGRAPLTESERPVFFLGRAILLGSKYFTEGSDRGGWVRYAMVRDLYSGYLGRRNTCVTMYQASNLPQNLLYDGFSEGKTSRTSLTFQY